MGLLINRNSKTDQHSRVPLVGAEVADTYTFKLFAIKVPIFANIRINILIFILKFVMKIYDFDRGCQTT